MKIKRYILEQVLRGPAKTREQFEDDWNSASGENWDRCFDNNDTDLFLCRMNPPLSDNPRTNVIIYSHGNFQDVSDTEVKLMCRKISDKTNSYVYAYEYPGYVDTVNYNIENAEANMVHTARTACKRVLDMHGEENVDFYISGFSLGAFMAIQMAIYSNIIKREIRRLVLVSAFASCISTRAPCFLSDGIFRTIDCFDNKRYLPKTTCDVTLVHGEDDRIVKAHNSKYLYWLIN